jgi:hypothetical protein
LLIRFHPFVSGDLQRQIDIALKKAFSWVLLNQVEDGGFVFRLNEKLQYGHLQMKSSVNQGAFFSTWFRTLSLALMLNRHESGLFQLNRCPGLLYAGN